MGSQSLKAFKNKLDKHPSWMFNPASEEEDEVSGFLKFILDLHLCVCYDVLLFQP